MSSLNIGDSIIVNIENINQYGNGFGKYKEFVVEVPKSCPGEEIKTKIIRINEKNKIITGLIEEILKPSENRENNCKIDKCFFCKTPNLSIKEKNKLKEEIVKKICKLNLIDQKKEFNFKNYITLYAKVIGNNLYLGFLDKKNADFVETKNCPLYTPEILELLLKNLETLNRDLDPETKKSIDKISIYYSEYEKTSLIVIECYKKEKCEIFKKIKPDVTSFYIKTKSLFFISGEKFIIDKINSLDIKFRIDPYNKIEDKTTIENTLKILDEVLKKIEPQKSLIIHSNNGLSTMVASRYSKLVYSIEKSTSLVRDILFNLKLNRIENVIVLKKPIEEILDKNSEITRDIDTIILHTINIDDIENIKKIAKSSNVKNIIVITYIEHARNYIISLSSLGLIFKEEESFAIDKEPHNYFINAILTFRRKNPEKMKIKIKKIGISTI